MLTNYQSVALAEIPPIQTSGLLSTVYREQSLDSGTSRNQNWLTLATVSASSYIWHPWFALVDGSLSFDTEKDDPSGQAATRSQHFGGKFQLNLFPGSRFPFLFYASTNRDELDERLFGRASTNTQIGMRQQYSSRDGTRSFSGKVEHNKRKSFTQEEFINDSLDFNARYQLKDHNYYGDIGYDKTSSSQDENATNYALAGRHSYGGRADLTLENLISSTQTHSDFSSSESDTKNNQFTSFASWRPVDRKDLSITGNFRLADLEQSATQKDTSLPGASFRQDQSTLNINQGLIYNYSPRITITESVNANLSDNGQSDQFFGSESAGISYSSDSLETSYGDYSWSTGSSASLFHGNNTASQTSLNNNIGHSISKDVPLTSRLNILSRFNQSASHQTRSDARESTSLSHSMTLSWSESRNDNHTSVQFQASDARTVSRNDNVFQLLNLQVNNDYRLSRNSHLLANMTLQNSRIISSGESNSSQFINGQLAYFDSRLLNKPNLRFTSRFKFSHQKSNSRIGPLTSDDSASDNSWENEMIYRIGLLETRLSLDYFKNQESYDRLLKIQFTRHFGNG